MRRKVWLVVTMAAVTVGLLVAAGLASPASSGTVGAAKKGGTMNINMSATDVSFTDPTLDYEVVGWQIFQATCVRLVNYPDKPAPEGSQLVPEAATGQPLISKDGKTYTFTVDAGFTKFNDGKPVTAQNFAFALNRLLQPVMEAPGTAFFSVIQGAQAVIDGKAKTASGIIVKGNKLTIKLTFADGALLAKLATPFVCAEETSLPLDPKGVLKPAMAGPYYIADRTVGRQVILKKNPFYKGTRPANVDTFVINVNTNLDQSLLQVKSGQVAYDMGGLPPTAHADLAAQFGVNKSQYHVNSTANTDYVALNTSRPAFGNVLMRKAANFAIDRPAMLRVRGKFAGRRTVQILPPSLSGYRDVGKVYPIAGSNYAKANDLAKQAGGCHDVNFWGGTSATGQALTQVAKYNLSQIGCNVNVKLFQGLAIYDAAGKKGAEFDAMLGGWFQDYPDPADFIDVLLNGDNIHDANNNNLAYLNVPVVNKAIEAADKLAGDARSKAFADLDFLLTTKYAPWAAYDNRNIREFTAANVGGYVYSPSIGGADLNTLFVK